MRILENLITDYVSSNFTESETLWISGTLYNNADEVRDGHYIYTYAGLNGTNTATKPSLNPNSWLKTRTTNYYAMLGDRTDEQTTVTGDLIFTIESNNYDIISLLNISGSNVLIQVYDEDENLVYTDSKSLNNTRDITDAYLYYFSPFVYFGTYYNNEIPLIEGTIKVTVSSLNGSAGVGRLVSGQSFTVGDTLFGSSQSLESYSRIETDEFGTTTLVPRASVYNSSHSLRILSQRSEEIKRKRKSLDAIPVLFIGDEDIDSKFENLLSYGLWQTADIVISRPNYSDMSVTVKELL